MGQLRNARKQGKTASALALLAVAQLAAFAGCGVRADSRLNQAPLPICNEVAPQTCQTLKNTESFAAPSWLVRCRRGWLQWRHGHETPVERETIVIPPPPRFHPVPTRPVFAPLEFETPFAASLTPQPMPQTQEKHASPPVPPTPNPKVFPEEVPAPSQESAPADPPAKLEPKPTQPPPAATETDEATGSQSAATAPKLLPRVLMPKTSRQTTIAPPVRATIKPNPISSKIPDAPVATEPLEESASSPAWKPRR